LFSGILRTGAVRTADLLGSEFSGAYYGECYVITGFWDVT